uniref:Uncharacterized protein n=1 Tax=Entomoneis paludosa TaxID=265537 RepID=A0A7S3DRG5_9STRA|eukprot:CAMPEP_0172453288 /NCGR_PEP_ID=MMETSP1065-20121228/10682_1 /TAXON_ID=265537 /ORGANISM="Amphiprora paludosa, Strain CCMP125" /LENGTH=203 /DNA_ID=CAMNT_0013205467 /DNA_START=63 /DNA_END=674 /DNA_ORIENTATION=-
MTIKLEQETILRVLECPPQLRRSQDDDIPSAVSASSSSMQADRLSFVELRKPLTPVGNVRDLTVEDDDTLSTASMSSDDQTIDRRVSFCEEAVTAVWTRPFTEKEDIPDLFYSSEDTARFRQEYRLEKKLLSELSLDPETCPVDEKDLSAMVATSPSSHAYRISRVVVLHNDKLETFVDQKKDAEVDGFFDNDSFWSGSITWY